MEYSDPFKSALIEIEKYPFYYEKDFEVYDICERFLARLFVNALKTKDGDMITKLKNVFICTMDMYDMIDHIIKNEYDQSWFQLIKDSVDNSVFDELVKKILDTNFNALRKDMYDILIFTIKNTDVKVLDDRMYTLAFMIGDTETMCEILQNQIRSGLKV